MVLQAHKRDIPISEKLMAMHVAEKTQAAETRKDQTAEIELIEDEMEDQITLNAIDRTDETRQVAFSDDIIDFDYEATCGYMR